uniref:tRNA wybutosine-synthesizing protein 4 n=2 Tax=Gouania willdenowi TaxID=441366 RepID=A0A8C5HNZ0_GOUWI
MTTAYGPQRRQKGKDTAVQGTNDSSVLSKVSAAVHGYFRDTFLQHFVCKVSRRAPLINRGYYVRWKAVDQCVKRFLQVTAECPLRQILSLGAGFDSLFFRLCAEGCLDHCVVFEVDFPDVTRRKCELIRSNDALREMLESQTTFCAKGVNVSSAQYRLVGCDIREELKVEEALRDARFDSSAPTLILSEVVLTYMETKCSDAVIQWAAKLLPQSLFVLYEQIRPHDPFGRIMQEHFQKLNSTLHALRQYPDIAAQRARFLEKGWECCECVDMNDFFLNLISEDERERVQSLEPFDEHEEWHQKCSHYFILTASQGALMETALLHHTEAPSYGLSCSRSVLTARPVPLAVEGLGMSCCSISEDRLLLTGGSTRGGRSSSIRLLHRGPEGWRNVSVETSADPGVRLYPTATVLPTGGVLVLGGRSSPLSPAKGLLRVTFDLSNPLSSGESANICVEPTLCTGNAPTPRWRHTAALCKHGGDDFLFVFGGKNQSKVALGDGFFLDLRLMQWTEVPVGGAAPVARHSHTACSYQGGVVLFGGLGANGAPLGDTTLLKPRDGGFTWESISVCPRPTPRYSHCACVINDSLLVVGGVWLHADDVPGVLVIDLKCGRSTEFSLDTSSVPRPLMLHSFCCEMIGAEEPELLLIGGGGNCFSFGTHLNPQPISINLH